MPPRHYRRTGRRSVGLRSRESPARSGYAWHRLPCGIDPAALLSQVRLIDDTVNWEELENELTLEKSGAASPDTITNHYQLARALFTNVALAHLASLEALPASARSRGQVTWARMATVTTVVGRAGLQALPTVPACLATSD